MFVLLDRSDVSARYHIILFDEEEVWSYLISNDSIYKPSLTTSMNGERGLRRLHQVTSNTFFASVLLKPEIKTFCYLCVSQVINT